MRPSQLAAIGVYLFPLWMQLNAQQPDIKIRTRRGNLPAATLASPEKIKDPTRFRQVVQFDQPPSPDEIAAIERNGIRIVEYIPDNALLVSVPADGRSARSESITGGYAEPLRASDKLSPEFDQVFAVLSSDPESAPEQAFVAEFHADVDQAAMRAIANQEGLLILDRPDLLPWHLLVKGTAGQMRQLAGWNEVAYLFPSSAELEAGTPLIGCAGAMTLNGRVAQYVAKVGDGWDGPGAGAAALKWSVERLTAKVPSDTTLAEIARAMAEWSKYVQVDFAPGGAKDSPKHLNFLFAAGAHGDKYAFDGAGKVLAHTYFPAPPNPEPLAGDLHFDDDEPWRAGADMDVFSVALHELGHALGLGHSDKPDAVMYAYYRQWKNLTAEDIAAIRELYAARSGDAPPPAPPVPEPKPTPPPTPAPNPPTDDKIAPQIRIVSPAQTYVSTTNDAITIKGTASDNAALKEVTWSSNASGTGVASGTAAWEIANLKLARGTNYIVIRAHDAAGNTSWRALTVTRR